MARDRGDRSDIAEWITSFVLPDDTLLLRGIPLGGSMLELAESLGRPGERGRLRFEVVPDEPGKDRLIEWTVRANDGRICEVVVSFFSDDKLDIDSSYRVLRKRLDDAFGRAATERDGASMSFVWRWTANGQPYAITCARFRHNETGRSVLKLAGVPG